MELTKAVFTDLDGTLITTKSGKAFPLHSEDWRLIPETIRGLKHYYDLGYKVIIVSNQAGIEYGYTTNAEFVKKITTIVEFIENRFKFKKNSISYLYCSYADSYYRKPNPGMAYDAAMDYELSLKDSVMFGDMETDREFADIAGIRTYFDILTIKSIDWDKH